VLPAKIAKTLCHVSELVGLHPFLDYTAYMLYNYHMKDPSKGLGGDNLEVIRKFHGSESEHGFMITHVAMDAFTGQQVKHAETVLETSKARDKEGLIGGLQDYRKTMQNINRAMDGMWKVSKPEDYQNFRTFIFGVKNQKFFPNGVRYEGVGDDSPRFYRGETGANDSIIPTTDNLMDFTFPTNPLTIALKDFRQYRPAIQNDYLSNVQARSQEAGVKEFSMSDKTIALNYLTIADQVREFRQRHWNFTKEYIIKHTDYPMATGGTPIIYWLPNQLGGMITIMEDIIQNTIGENHAFESSEENELFQTMKTRCKAQLSILNREVEDLSKQYPDLTKEDAL